jgi:hypothetical protein
LRDTNEWRQSKGRDKIVIGEKYYGDEDQADASSTANQLQK